MTYDEYVALKTPRSAPGIHVSEVGGEDRTLIYGYTLGRSAFHAYKKDGELHVLVHDGEGRLPVCYVHGLWLNPEAFAPDKRAYPEDCDFEFCRLLQSRGVDVCFTTYREFSDNHNAAFKGLTAEELGR